MRVVELDRDLVGNQTPVPIPAVEAAYQVGQRAGHEKVFLHKTQRLPDRRAVVGIEHPRQRFRRESSGKRTDKIAAAELLKIEIVG
jgi:hypothetical protein